MVSHFGKNGPLVVTVMWIETIIALIVVAARVYTRTRLVRSIGWDDYLIFISMFLFLGYTILCTIATVNGMGSHMAGLGLSQGVIAVKWEMSAQTFNIAAIGTSKSSVAVFLLRIVTRKVHIYGLWFCILSTAIVCASCIIFMFTQCTPLESVFNPTLPHTCYMNFTTDAIFSGSYTATMDFVLAVVPWFILWKLNMKRKERLTITLGLSLGVLAGICGIVRAVQLRAIAGKTDYTFLTIPLILWGSTELFVCILCASIPTLRPLYKHVRGQGSSSAGTPYELGNTPSHPLTTESKSLGKTGNKSYHSRSASHGLDDSLVGGHSGTTSTNVYMGGNNSSEEILKESKRNSAPISGDLEWAGDNVKNGQRNSPLMSAKVIQKTTQVDVSYS